MVKTNTEYRTPNCEVVNVHAQSSLLAASDPDLYFEGGAGSYNDDTTNDNGSY